MPVVQKMDTIQIPTDGREIEPIWVQDETMSMRGAVANHRGAPTRIELSRRAFMAVCGKLSELDSQAEREAAAGLDAGGVRTIGFGADWAHDYEDFNPKNFDQKWAELQFNGRWTELVPGLRKAAEVYADEFSKDEAGNATPPEERPIAAVTFVTDGPANDLPQFVRLLSNLDGDTYVVLVLIGYGPEHTDAALEYKKVAQQNSHFYFVDHTEESDPSAISDAVLTLLGKN